jgi:hypothetical protein
MNPKHILFPAIFLFSIAAVRAQAPQSFKYQAVVRDTTGAVLAHQPVGLQISILKGGMSGTVVYQETPFPVETNDFGLFTVNVGEGNPVQFQSIDWSADAYYLNVGMDPKGGTTYTAVTGTSQILSVPYALYARDVENKDDADADSTNEIQNLTAWGNMISITGGDTIVVDVNDADPDPGNELQTISKSGNMIQLSSGGGSVLDAVDDADPDPFNEIQNLVAWGNMVAITGGDTVVVDVNDADPDPANELQTLTKTGNLINLSSGGGSVTDEVDDADPDPVNEIQTVSKSNFTVTLSKGGGLSM